jgi:PPK2 family polyphosphate:nucleotide phosphotransferase
VFEAVPSPYLVPFDGSFVLAHTATVPPPDAPRESQLEARLAEHIAALSALQGNLYAQDRHSLLLIFQALDAAGKDSTIKAVTSGVNPAGFQVHGFGPPSDEEIDHDWLWRTTQRLPERGRIGVFNRSYYEEVLVVRVHPELLEAQRLPDVLPEPQLWQDRYASIRDHERHLARSGTAILKFWLNVSKDEQRRRFLDRIEEPQKHWKFRVRDVEERAHWDAYMTAYEEALRETSRSWAPWYAIPADDKDYMRTAVADIIVRALQQIDPEPPEPSEEQLEGMREARKLLEAEGGEGKSHPRGGRSG